MTTSLDIDADFYARLRAFIRSKVREPDDADDILHDALGRALERRGQLRDATRATAWLYGIVRSAIGDFYRRGGSEEARAARHDSDGLADVELAEAPDANDNAAIAGCLAAMLRDLPPKYRDAVALTEIDGLPQTELAARLGMSASGAKSRVQRGRALLRERLLACCAVERDRRGNIINHECRDNPAADASCACGD